MLFLTLCLLALNEPFLVQEKRIEIPAQADYAFLGPDAMVHGDANGNILIVDPLSNGVWLLDSEGKLLRTVAQKGSGPGEFSGLLDMVPRGQDAVALEVERVVAQIHAFDGGYHFLDQKTKLGSSLILIQAAISPVSNQFTASYILLEAPGKKAGTAIFNFDFEVQNLIQETQVAVESQRDRRFWVNHLAGNLERFFKTRTHFCYDQKGNLYSALCREPSIQKWDLGVKKSKQISFSHSPQMRSETDQEILVDALLEEIRADRELMEIITPAVVAEAIQQAEIPTTKDTILGIFALRPDLLMVVRELDLMSGKANAILVSESGSQGEIEIPSWGLVRLNYRGYQPSMTVFANRAYSLQKHDDDFFIVVYRIQ
ncbi:MAG: hypothetical protein H6510_00905 [Acidobacteria bacterium]|nr:hypothetical protein [Acidobacteriota bacterium]MCB9396347.1 hypothetical protein [Acidobacteriota bacterium]